MRLIFFFLFPVFVFAQNSIEDPAAKLVLDEMSSQYKRVEEIEASFKLIVDFPEEDFVETHGSLLQQENSYSLKYGDTEVIQDAHAVYLINHADKTIQINDIPTSSEASQNTLYNPKKLMSLYAQGVFEYAFVGREDFRGSILKLIEFKPKDRYASYSKIRLALRKENKIAYIKVFNKDGTKLTVEMVGFVLNEQRKKLNIAFDSSSFKQYSFEDLRM